MTQRVLVLGAFGQLGNALQKTAPQNATVIGRDLPQTDICQRDSVARAIDESRPDLIINCAAFTKVDDAETRPDEALAANGVAPGILAELARQSGVRLFHLSTDYVFDGRAHSPYLPDDPTGPLSVYGATKLEGERRVLAEAPDSVIVRTAWLHTGGGVNFIDTAVRLLSSGTRMRVVDDQLGTPTRATHLATALWHVASRPDLRGILHFTDAGVASWYDVATAVLEAMRAVGKAAENAAVIPVGTEEFPRPARRPQFSVLDKRSSWIAIGYMPPHWRDGVIASTNELLKG